MPLDLFIVHHILPHHRPGFEIQVRHKGPLPITPPNTPNIFRPIVRYPTNSSAVIKLVPRLPTTMPAARLAN